MNNIGTKAFYASALCVLLTAIHPALAEVGDLYRANTGATASVNASDDSELAAVSSDGRYIVFASGAANLVSGDTNGRTDIFLYDRQAGTMERISRTGSGAQTSHDSSSPSISADGRYVAFSIYEESLLAEDTNGDRDVYVFDRQLSLLELISRSSAGVAANDSSDYPSISATGRYVVFESDATNLTAGDVNSRKDVFLRDRQLGTTVLISVSSDDDGADGDSRYPDVSSDGNYVVFQSEASDLMDGVPGSFFNGHSQIFVRNLSLNQTRLSSITPANNSGGNGDSSEPDISPDGTWVVFSSDASNLSADLDTNSRTDVFLRDRNTGTNYKISWGDGLAQADENSDSPAVSDDGNYVAFRSSSTNMDSGDAYVSSDIYLYDRDLLTTTRYNLNSAGEQFRNNSYTPALSGDGAWLAFKSYGALDSSVDTDFLSDIYLSPVSPFQLTRVSQAPSSTTEPDAEAGIYGISADGRYVLFSSEARNLLSSPRATRASLYLFDTLTRSTTLPASLPDGSTLDSYVGDAAISADGRYIAFEYGAEVDLIGAAGGQDNILLKDMINGDLTLVNVNGAGAQSTGGASNPHLSADGRYVMFSSSAADLVAENIGGQNQLFVRDTTALSTALVSRSSAGEAANAAIPAGNLSRDGRHAVFESSAANLVAGDTNDTTDIFVHDLDSGATERVNLSTAGAQAVYYSSGSDISPDGRYVAFSSLDPDLTAGDTNWVYDIFLRDRQSNETHRISVDAQGQETSSGGLEPRFSTDGAYISWYSSGDLTNEDSNEFNDVYVYSLASGLNERLSVRPDGTQGNGGSLSGWFSDERATGAFNSYATNLDSADQYGVRDIFITVYDFCPSDSAKTLPGTCGCGIADADANANGRADCLDPSTSYRPPRPRVTVARKMSKGRRKTTVTMAQFTAVKYQVRWGQGKKKVLKTKLSSRKTATYRMLPGRYWAKYRLKVGSSYTKWTRLRRFRVR